MSEELIKLLTEARDSVDAIRNEHKTHGHITDASAHWLIKVKPRIDEAISALTAQQEPVAWLVKHESKDYYAGAVLEKPDIPENGWSYTPLYTAPLSGVRAGSCFSSDGWNYQSKPNFGENARKFVTLKSGGMAWVGIRAWNAQGHYWQNNGEPIQNETVTAWRDMPEPAKGFWLNGQLHGITRAADQQADAVVVPRLILERAEKAEALAEQNRKALIGVKATLESANEKDSGPITDTIWHTPTETLFDFIDAAIDSARAE
jgi:hypothetical protein